MSYTVRIYVDDEGGWNAQVDEVPECLTCGDDLAELTSLIRDALRLWVHDADTARLHLYLHSTAWAKILGVSVKAIENWFNSAILDGEVTAEGPEGRSLRLDAISGCLMLLATHLSKVGFSRPGIEKVIPLVAQGYREVLKPGHEAMRLYLGIAEGARGGEAQIFPGTLETLRIQAKLTPKSSMGFFDLSALYERVQRVEIESEPGAVGQGLPSVSEVAVPV